MPETVDIHPYDLFLLMEETNSLAHRVGEVQRHRDFGPNSYDWMCDVVELKGQKYVEDTAVMPSAKAQERFKYAGNR